MASVQQNLKVVFVNFAQRDDHTCTRGRMQRPSWCSIWRIRRPSRTSSQTSVSPTFCSRRHRRWRRGSCWGCGTSCSPLASTASGCIPVGLWGTPWGSELVGVLPNTWKRSRRALVTRPSRGCTRVGQNNRWSTLKFQLTEEFYVVKIFKNWLRTSVITIQQFPTWLDCCEITQTLDLKKKFLPQMTFMPATCLARFILQVWNARALSFFVLSFPSDDFLTDSAEQ